MGKVVRFSVSLEEDLLKDFDHFLKKKKISSRSDGLRKLIREKLTQEAIVDPEKNIFATLSLIYSHKEHHFSEEITEIQHRYYEYIISTTHIHLNEEYCFEVIILRGKSKFVCNIAQLILSLKGIICGDVSYSFI